MLFVFKLLMSKYFYAKASPPPKKKLTHNKSTFGGKIV